MFIKPSLRQVHWSKLASTARIPIPRHGSINLKKAVVSRSPPYFDKPGSKRPPPPPPPKTGPKFGLDKPISLVEYIFVAILSIALGISIVSSGPIKELITDPVVSNFDVVAPSKYDTMPEGEFLEFKKKVEASRGAGVQVHIIDFVTVDPDNRLDSEHGQQVSSIVNGHDFSMAPDADTRFHGNGITDGLRKIYETVQGPAVVSISLVMKISGNPFVSLLDKMEFRHLVRKLVEEKGVVVLCAAGNERTTEEALPLSTDGVWKIGALKRQNVQHEREIFKSEWHVSLFSNRGPWVAFYALGEDMQTGFYSKWNGEKIIQHSTKGTSFSCPLVACILARFYSVDPNATLSDAYAFLKRISTKVVMYDQTVAYFLPTDQSKVFSDEDVLRPQNDRVRSRRQGSIVRKKPSFCWAPKKKKRDSQE